MKHTARNAAIEALLQVEENEGYSNLVLDKVLRAYELSGRDSALASAIFYGTLEKEITLDHFLEQCFLQPGKPVSKKVRIVLRAAAYQLMFLDRIPASAVVNEAVESIKELKMPGAAGFVNGVLRGFLRKQDTFSYPQGDTAKALSVRHSIPAELIELWQKSYGLSFTRKLLSSLDHKAPIYLRVNSLKTDFLKLQDSFSAENIVLSPCSGSDHAGVLENCGSPMKTPQFQKGLFHIQDLSAQLLCLALGAEPHEHICDCCAAPGGKSFTIAEEMGNEGRVTSLDLYKGRVGLITEGANRLGLSCVRPGVNDALKGFPDIPPADRVLCDVPCSGFGVIRRKPEIRYKKLDTVESLPGLQYEILQNASKLVKPGGVLLYSTCTLDPRENEEVAERFLKENNGFIPRKIEWPQTVEQVQDLPEHMALLTPFSGGSDGFFAAMFQRA